MKQFWDDSTETKSIVEIENLESPLIRDQISYVIDNSDYYRGKFEDAGVSLT